MNKQPPDRAEGEPFKINVGCGHFPLEGYLNIDLQAEEANVIGDFREMKYEDVDEITMYHVLEHISWHDTVDVLVHLRSWLKYGGKIVVEVPDMEVLMALGTGYPTWVQAIYGEGSTEGEIHRAGFNAFLLVQVLTKASLKVEIPSLRRFASDHPMRENMPCIEATAYR